ncbi:ATP-dependent helicase HepA [Pelotomaculum schinkii]|uniref:ATP-dependent helicase HepA n=1 Tax=Pelotomaculum schinkii TaxID=78350 RepID=A0A4Y7RG85_9FIRM|nr:DEAD/DEAH box helicase [Pelotomaculum schinkii]TEB07793.1 ATP-dependent helicase HepA [Pelotomaculum schinkii]
MTDNRISVFSEWLPGKGFIIWAAGADHTTVFHELKYLLFARHKASYYGTFIDTGSHRGREALYLSPLTSLDFFTTRTWSGELDWRWSDETRALMEAAPRFRKALAAGCWKPDFDKWREGRRGWRMDWERASGCGDLPVIVPFIDEWADLIINNLIEEKPEIGRTWEKILSSYPVLIPAQDRSQPLTGDEETWLEAAGWQQDHTPFRTCLELAEPDGEDTAWLLNIILQDKEDRGSLAAWEPGAMRPDWQEHSDRVERDIQKWIDILPWLQDSRGEGSAGLRRELTEVDAWEFLNTGSIQLAQAGHTVFLPKWWQEVQKLVPSLKIRTRSSVGSSKESLLGVSQIVQFDWNLAVGGLELPEEEFRKLVAKKRRLVRIQGKWIQLDPAFVKKIQQYLRKKDGISLGEILHMRLLTPVDETSLEPEPGPAEALQVEVELSGQFARMVEQLNNLDQIPILETIASFYGSLRRYQLAGASWLLFLRRFGLGGCLADDMGLGKTIQWIAYLLKVQENENPPCPSLLICPTSVLGNWQKELARFAPSLKVQLHYGPQRAKGPDFLSSIEGVGLVITSYNLAHIDEEDLAAVEWDCICLDEAQNIKNAYTKQAAAVRKFKGRHRIAMTGTPMENRLTELWSLFDFINPGYLGSSKEFNRSFISAIEKKGDATDIGRVQKLIRPFLLRRVKNDPAIELDLPEKQEQKEYIPLTVEQASLYESVLEDLFNKLEKSDGMARRGLILSTLMKLKQICDHPALFLKEGPLENINAGSKKVERLLEMIAELRQQGDRCLIFTQFIRMGQLLQEVILKELGEESYYLHGGTPRKERDEMVARFQDTGSHNYNIFILSLKAGGLGLNLTAANHVFHFDRWWNPAVENQATDRSHRIGQNRHVMVHKFISLGTMEERIDEVLERKSSLNEQIIGAGEAWVTEISTSELRELFSLRKEWVGA